MHIVGCQDVIWIFLNSLPLGMFEEGQIQGAAKYNEAREYIRRVMLTQLSAAALNLRRESLVDDCVNNV